MQIEFLSIIIPSFVVRQSHSRDFKKTLPLWRRIQTHRNCIVHFRFDLQLRKKLDFQIFFLQNKIFVSFSHDFAREEVDLSIDIARPPRHVIDKEVAPAYFANISKFDREVNQPRFQQLCNEFREYHGHLQRLLIRPNISLPAILSPKVSKTLRREKDKPASFLSGFFYSGLSSKELKILF